MPALIKSFATSFEHLQTIKFLPQQRGFTVFHSPAANDNKSKFRRQREGLFRRIKGFNIIQSFNIIHPSWAALQAGEQVSPSWPHTSGVHFY